MLRRRPPRRRVEDDGGGAAGHRPSRGGGAQGEVVNAEDMKTSVARSEDEDVLDMQ